MSRYGRPRMRSTTVQNNPSAKPPERERDHVHKGYNLIITEDAKGTAGMAEYGKVASQAVPAGWSST